MITTTIKPEQNIKIIYTAEYTNELEVDPDFENIKQIKTKDMEELVYTMFQLRKQEKHNISIGFLVEKENDWFIEDYANSLEFLNDSRLSDKLESRLSKQNETVTELVKELGLYQEFISKYNATEQFKEFKKEITIKEAS